jgi:hypothetical protein
MESPFLSEGTRIRSGGYTLWWGTWTYSPQERERGEARTSIHPALQRIPELPVIFKENSSRSPVVCSPVPMSCIEAGNKSEIPTTGAVFATATRGVFRKVLGADVFSE